MLFLLLQNLPCKKPSYLNTYFHFLFFIKPFPVIVIIIIITTQELKHIIKILIIIIFIPTYQLFCTWWLLWISSAMLYSIRCGFIFTIIIILIKIFNFLLHTLRRLIGTSIFSFTRNIIYKILWYLEHKNIITKSTDIDTHTQTNMHVHTYKASLVPRLTQNSLWLLLHPLLSEQSLFEAQ